MTTKKHIFHTLLKGSLFTMLLLLLSSCDLENNFFYHPVEYNGEQENPHLVVQATLRARMSAQVWVSRSWFFLDKEDRNDWRSRLVKGACVEERINDGEWIQLKYHSDGVGYFGGPGLKPGDKVEIRVQHPAYPDAYATQVIPQPVLFYVTDLRLDSISEYDKYFCFNIHVPAYTGNPEDVMVIKATTTYYDEHFYQKRYYDYDKRDYVYTGDTTVRSYYTEDWILSTDMRFAAYTNINQDYNGHYVSSLGLYCATNNTGNEIVIPVRTQAYQYFHQYDSGEYLKRVTEEIYLHVETVTRDEYLFTASMVAADLIYNRAYYRGEGSGGDMGDDIVADIEDMFNAMGTMEGVQDYGNVEGAYGHVGASTSEPYIILF